MREQGAAEGPIEARVTHSTKVVAREEGQRAGGCRAHVAAAHKLPSIVHLRTRTLCQHSPLRAADLLAARQAPRATFLAAGHAGNMAMPVY